MLIESLGIQSHLCVRLHQYGIRFARDLVKWTVADLELLLGGSNATLVVMASRSRGFPLEAGDPAKARERLEQLPGVHFLELAQPAGAPPRLVLEGSPEHRALQRASEATSKAMVEAGYEKPSPEIIARAQSGGPAVHYDRGAFKARQEERELRDGETTSTALCFIGMPLENTPVPNVSSNPKVVTCHRCLARMVRVMSADEVADREAVHVQPPALNAPAMHLRKEGSDAQSACFDNPTPPLPNTTLDPLQVTCHRCKALLAASGDGKPEAVRELASVRDVTGDALGEDPVDAVFEDSGRVELDDG